MSALKRLSSLLGIFRNDGLGVPFANRNLVIDGAKELWIVPSGTPVAVAVGASYSLAAPMYMTACGTGGVGTYTQAPYGSGPSGRLGVPRPARNGGNLTLTTGSTGTLAVRDVAKIGVRIEDYRLLEGCSVTLSVFLSATAALTIPQITAIQSFGGGGSPTANINTTYPLSWAIPATTARFSVRLDIPAQPAVTEGTTANSLGFTQFVLELPPGWVGTLRDSFWQIEFSDPSSSSDITGNGGNPTVFEHRGTALELARTARYYQTIPNFLVAGNGSAGQLVYTDILLPAPMRISPAVSVTGAATYVNASAYTATAVGNTGIRGQINVTAAGYGYGYGGTLAIVADARV